MHRFHTHRAKDRVYVKRRISNAAVYTQAGEQERGRQCSRDS